MKLNWKKKPKWFKIASIFFCLLLIAELVLRFIVGLGDYAIYRADKDYEYFYESKQNVWRYGNHIMTNEFGMRSKKINKKKKITILEFGDSVLNGGAHVDQNQLATTMEENELNNYFNNEVQILNISAQSWGPSNAFAFLKKHGRFNAKIIVLVFSSHDLNDNMHFKNVVGVEPAWPAEKPYLALTDVWSRFLWPKIKSIISDYDEYAYLKNFNDSKINPGWENFYQFSINNNIKLLVYLHATQSEVENGEYDSRGKKIFALCKQKNIKVISDIKALKGNNDAFIDNIHLNSKGHQIMTNLMIPELKACILKTRSN